MGGRFWFAVRAGLACACIGCGSPDDMTRGAEGAGGRGVTQPGVATISMSSGILKGSGSGALAPATSDGGRPATGESPAGTSGIAGADGTAGSKSPEAGSGKEPDDADAGSGEQRPVVLHFKAVVGNQDFDCDASYAAGGGNGLRFTPADFRFYVQDVRLVTRAGREVPVQLDERAPVQTHDVALLDFGEETGGCALLLGARRVNRTLTARVPEGDYSAVVFTTGVPEALNHRDLTQARPPLDDTSMYWGWSNGYRFVSLMLDAVTAEGMAIQTGVHIGSTGCTSSQNAGWRCARPNRNRVQLDNFDVDESTILADFGAAVAELDLSVVNECHGGEPQCAHAFSAFGLGPGGEVQITQRVFRLE